MDIKMLVMDVDGTLTDGKIHIGANGEIMKSFDVKDGYAIAHMLPAMGIVPVILTGRKSEIVAIRASELGIKELHQGVQNKLEKLKEISAAYQLNLNQIAYIGDDINDLECIQLVGFAACPADSVEQVKMKSNYCCIHNGGVGAVREFIEYLYSQK